MTAKRALTFFVLASAVLPAQNTSASGSSATQPSVAPKLPPELVKALERARAAESAAGGRPVVQAPTGATPTSPQDAPDPRVPMLGQQKFDRRPSSILAAWARPEPKPPDADPELALPETPAAGTPPDPSAAQKTAELTQKRLAREFEILGRHVTLGRWDAVGAFLGTLPEKDRKPAYATLLGLLPNPPQQQNRGMQLPPNLQERNDFAFDDVFAIARIAPGGLQKEQVAALVPLINLSLDAGRVFDELRARLVVESERPEAERVVDRRGAARILAALGRDTELGAFLPTAEEAIAASDREALNLLARFHLAQNAKDGARSELERAWEATQAALAVGEIDEAEKADALRRAVALAPRIRAEFGASWLQESFTSRPERGREILATLGGQVARGPEERAQDTEFRREGLRLQKLAVDALLAIAPERATEWRDALRILATSWQREAEHSYRYSEASSLGPMMQRDAYGNLYYVNGGRWGRSPVAALEPADLLENRPEGAWLDLLEESVKPTIASVTARLYLKVGEDERAFPAIQALAATHPDEAQELANEFLRVWIKNHDPNSDRNRTDSYLFAYGYNQRAAGIPLTRSKQDRNLEDLGKVVARLRTLPIKALDEKLLVQAFTSSHSAAEVYRLDHIQAVFGGLDALAPKTIAELAQQMRANLADTWRKPRTQDNAKTNRKQKDIEREVMRGYDVAGSVVAQALQKYADDWRLVLAKAALELDKVNFQREVEGTASYATERATALGRFQQAAKLYAASLDPDSTQDESSEVYESWFYAGLGASDLAAVDDRAINDASQPARIKAAIDALPGEAAERHLGRFANSLFTRMSAVNPSIKFRYLDAGFAIVGDHPKAVEARKVYDYYKDLVTEIRLDVHVDGAAEVGHGEPFGLRVDLVFTREIERESGGFAKYLQNQANQQYSYNYGRPLENYRDKFEEAARAALLETFEVQSITFNAETAHSKATDDYGWRRMPYAYLLVTARRPEVDKIPPLKLDLDFLDTSGYVVLPIGSPTVPIDASAGAVERPYHDVEITQILDERKAGSGVLSVEVKAKAQGLVPALDDLVKMAPRDFVVDKVDDQGVAVTSFADDQDGIVSERTFVVTLRARDDLEAAPKSFRFGEARDPAAKVIYQRYDDADLMPAGLDVELGETYGAHDLSGMWLLLPTLLAFAGVIFWLRATAPKGPAGAGPRITVPESITPFTVLGMLRDIEAQAGLGDAQRRGLHDAIRSIERHYFAGGSKGTEPDLRKIAEDWARAAG